jgi:tetratricopeptide (TPR) repeat protein
MSGNLEDRAAVTEPFPGPRPFASSESRLFKGRERESRDVRDLILSYQVVVLYAKSGTGKSSLVNAGLRPLLIEEGFEILPVIRVGGKIPPQIDQAKVSNVFVFNAISACAGEPTDPASLLDAKLGQYLGRTSQNPRILVLDQFEELFTTFPDRWRDREPFVLELQKLCQSNKDLRLLLVIREDHLAELDAYADLLPGNLRIRYRLERLREEEALQAIVLPVNLAGYAFEKEVDKELVANLRTIHVQTENGTKEVTGEFVEPVHLQVVCRNLWNNRPKETCLLTSADVKKFADVNESLAAFYVAAVRAAAAQTRVREGKIRFWVEEKLITAGGTRGLVYMGSTSTEELPNEAVRVLEQEHVISAESRAGALWYELTHDRFIGPIRASNRPWFVKRRRRKYIALALAVALLLVGLSIPIYRSIKQDTLSRHLKQDAADAAEADSEMLEGRNGARDDEWDAALEHYRAALQLYTRVGDRGSQALAYVQIGKAYTWKDQWLEAASNYKKALEIHRRRGEDDAVRKDLRLVGSALLNGEDYTSAIDYFSDALRAYQQAGSEEKPAGQAHPRESGDASRQINDYKNPEDRLAIQAEILTNLGTTYRWLNDYQRSEDCLYRSMKLYSQLKQPLPREEAQAKFNLATFYLVRGDYDRAIPLLKQVRNTFVEDGNFNYASYAAVNLGSGLLAVGKSADSLRAFEQGLAGFQRAKNNAGVGYALAKTADWYVNQHLCKKSLSYANRALDIGEQVNSKFDVMRARRIKARANLCANSLQDAAAETQRALEMSNGDKWEQAYNLETLAMIAEAKGDLQDAIQNGQNAVTLWDSIGSRTVEAQTARANLIRWQKSAKLKASAIRIAKEPK